MDRRYWVVLKVVLARPWTRLVLGFWVLSWIAVCVPLSYLNDFRQPNVAIPGFDQPGLAILQASDVQRFRNGSSESLSDVETLDTAVLQDVRSIISDGQLKHDSNVNDQQGYWPILSQLPQLKSLSVRPGHVINAAGWEQIVHLSKLESLWVPNSSAESAEKSAAAKAAAVRAIGQLTSLRQINIENSSLPPLPPMPNLEYAVLDSLTSLELNLKTLAEHSPKLREIALRPFDGFQLTSSMRDSLRRMQALQTIWIWTGRESEADVLIPQLAILRASLPNISVRRGEYSRFRSMALFIFAVTMFWPFLIVEVHRSMMLSMPQAAYIPGYERPHLFWPLLASILFVIILLAVCSYFGVAWYAALALGLSNVFSLPAFNTDWNHWLKKFVSWSSLLLMMGLFAFVSSLKFAPLFAEEFLAGELPAVAAIMICLAMILTPFRYAGATRQYRLLAELPTPIIPGLMQYEEQCGRAVPSANNPWNGLFRISEFFTSLQLKRSRSKDFTAKLIAAMTGTTTRITLFLFIALMMWMIHQFVLPDSNAPLSPILGIALLQGSLTNLLLTMMAWRGRRSSLALDLLRPVSREQFWTSIQIAVLKEMLPTVLLTIAGVFGLVWMDHKSVQWSAIVPVVLLSGCGTLAILHASTIWICVAPRLWLAMTMSLVGLFMIVVTAVPTVPLILNEGGNPQIAILLSVLLVVAGMIAQFAIRRSLPNRELGMISR